MEVDLSRLATTPISTFEPVLRESTLLSPLSSSKTDDLQIYSYFKSELDRAGGNVFQALGQYNGVRRLSSSLPWRRRSRRSPHFPSSCFFNQSLRFSLLCLSSSPPAPRLLQPSSRTFAEFQGLTLFVVEPRNVLQLGYCCSMVFLLPLSEQYRVSRPSFSPSFRLVAFRSRNSKSTSPAFPPPAFRRGFPS